VPLAIAVSTWPADTPIFVARDKGFFKAEGLDLTLRVVDSGHLGLAAALSGEVDLCTVSESPIARAALAGKPVAVVASICKIEEPLQIISRRDLGIGSIEDLKGRRLGVVRGSVAEFFSHIFLTISGIDPREVSLVDVPPDRQAEALLSGRVDAVATWAPHTIVLRNQLGDNASVFGDPTVYTMIWNVAGTRSFVRTNPEIVAKVLRALIKANEFMSLDPAESRAISARNIGVKSGLFDGEWKNYRFATVLDQGLLLDLDSQAAWMRQSAGESARPIPNFLDVVAGDVLRGIRPDAVTIPGG
jgi:NitT/TauT family transport system substrate-binding protein